MKKIKTIFALLLLFGFAFGQGKNEKDLPPASNCTFNMTDSRFIFNEASQKYWFKFTGEIDGVPLDPTSSWGDYYGIEYRLVGSNNWIRIYSSIANIPGSINLEDIYLEIGSSFLSPLIPCGKYQVRITCDWCFNDLNDLINPYWVCLDEHFDNGNVSQIFTITVPANPDVSDPVTNLHVESAPDAYTRVISWDPHPLATSYKIEVIGTDDGFNQCGQVIFLHPTNSITITRTPSSTCNPCDYYIRVTPNLQCGTPTSAEIQVDYGDCTVFIDNIDVQIDKTIVHWDVITGSPTSFSISWWPTSNPNNINTIINAGTQVELTNLLPNETYRVEVTPICGSNGAGCTQYRLFTSSCESYEPNNTPNQAHHIEMDESVKSGLPLGDVDYYWFVPTCKYIQVKSNSGYSILKNGVPVEEESIGYSPPAGFYKENFYSVELGQTYMIRFNNNSGQSRCYNFSIIECSACFDDIPAFINGDQNVHLEGLAEERVYDYQAPAGAVDWIIGGTASVTVLEDNGNNIKLRFAQLGQVHLTVKETDCDGNVKFYPSNGPFVIDVVGQAPPSCTQNSTSPPSCSITGPSGFVCGSMSQANYSVFITGGNYNSHQWETSSSGAPLTVQNPTANSTNISGFQPNKMYSINHIFYCNEVQTGYCTATVLTILECMEGGDQGGSPNTEDAVRLIQLESEDRVLFLGDEASDEPYPQGLGMSGKTSSLSVYPNPVARGSKLYILSKDETSTITAIQLLDNQGKLLEELPKGKNYLEVETINYPNGMYFIRFNLNGKIETRKFSIIE